MEIEVSIDRFENEKAILKTDDNETIIWPKQKLPDNIHEGSIFNISLNKDGKKESDRKQLAKDILNEILDTEKR